MSAYRFQRDGAEWSREEWRALGYTWKKTGSV